jgi:hypothetical protein
VTILDIINTILHRQILAQLAAAPMTVAAAAADVRASYAPAARGIIDKLALLEKTAAQVTADEAAAAQLLADSIFYSNDVNARMIAGAVRAVAVDAAFNSDADATRKARWTLAAVRALFGL